MVMTLTDRRLIQTPAAKGAKDRETYEPSLVKQTRYEAWWLPWYVLKHTQNSHCIAGRETPTKTEVVQQGCWINTRNFLSRAFRNGKTRQSFRFDCPTCCSTTYHILCLIASAGTRQNPNRLNWRHLFSSATSGILVEVLACSDQSRGLESTQTCLLAKPYPV